MIYIINENIEYNSDDCTLKHQLTADVIKLSITAGRLLEKLLHSDGAVVSRDTLLIEVWDTFGLQGSHNNLTQYISILRRAFNDWGCHGLIMTIPKIGLQINTDISILRNDSLVTQRDPNNNEEIKKIKKLHHSRKAKLKVLSIFIIAILILLSFLYFRRGDDNTVTVKEPGGCEITFIKNIGIPRQEFLFPEIMKIMKENDVKCEGDSKIFFVNYTYRSTKNLGRTLAAYCKVNDNGQVISCDNFYYRDWRVE